MIMFNVQVFNYECQVLLNHYSSSIADKERIKEYIAGINHDNE